MKFNPSEKDSQSGYPWWCLLVCNCGSVTFKVYAVPDYHVGVECTVCGLTKEVTL